MVTHVSSRPASAEERLKELGIQLPTAPEPFGIYAEAVQTSNLLFLTGMLPTEGRGPKFVGRIGAELGVEAGRQAARTAALNALALARQHLGSLDKVTRVVRLGSMWPLREISAATQGLLTALQSCCRTFSGKRRTLVGWFTEWPVYRSGQRSSWN